MPSTARVSSSPTRYTFRMSFSSNTYLSPSFYRVKGKAAARAALSARRAAFAAHPAARFGKIPRRRLEPAPRRPPPVQARPPAAGGQKILLRGGYLRPNDGARLCTHSVDPRKPPSKHSAYVRTAASPSAQRQRCPRSGKAALVNQRRLHARSGREVRIRLLHLPLPYFFDFIRTRNGKRCGVRPYAGQSGAFCVQ